MPKGEIFPSANLEDIKENVLWSNNLYDRADIEWYTKFNRFGVLDPFNAPSGSREYTFFTKPDLHILKPHTDILNPELKNQSYFVELYERYPDVIAQLQKNNAIGDTGPFMAVLTNALKNTVDLTEISSTVIDTPQTIYGTAYNYRGWGYNADEKIDFSLEFEDTRYLEIYNLFKAYEEYERLKHLGMVTPPNIDKAPEIEINGMMYSFNYYIRNKVLHDQFSIYKFIVEDDGETIMYYAKLWGVFVKNVPRDTFSDFKIDGGLRLAVNFEAAFVDDMNPSILADFNSLIPKVDQENFLPIYNKDIGGIDGSWASLPVVYKVPQSSTWNGPGTMKHSYKLKWRR